MKVDHLEDPVDRRPFDTCPLVSLPGRSAEPTRGQRLREPAGCGDLCSRRCPGQRDDQPIDCLSDAIRDITRPLVGNQAIGDDLEVRVHSFCEWVDVEGMLITDTEEQSSRSAREGETDLAQSLYVTWRPTSPRVVSGVSGQSVEDVLERRCQPLQVINQDLARLAVMLKQSDLVVRIALTSRRSVC